MQLGSPGEAPLAMARYVKLRAPWYVQPRLFRLVLRPSFGKPLRFLAKAAEGYVVPDTALMPAPHDQMLPCFPLLFRKLQEQLGCPPVPVLKQAEASKLPCVLSEKSLA